MFGALNRFIARLDAEPQGQEGGSRGACGFQVLRNNNGETPIEPWFDFIIGINGRRIDNPDPTLFATEIKNSAGSSISLGLWSAKGQRIREIYVSVPIDSTSLGLSLQWNALSITEDVWHILEVTPKSPADQAGLLPYGDYVIGSPEAIMKGESGLGEVIQDRLDTPLNLHVYNHEYNVTRPVTITPSHNWGGTGALGCVLGFGALHRLPPPLDEPPQGPGETLFETARFSNEGSRPSMGSDGGRSRSRNANVYDNHSLDGIANDHPQSFMVPAEMPNVTTGAPPAKSRKSRPNHTGATAMLDDYFAEGEAKSREHDRDSPRPGASTIAPPPKATAVPPPPKATPRSPPIVDAENGNEKRDNEAVDKVPDDIE